MSNSTVKGIALTCFFVFATLFIPALYHSGGAETTRTTGGFGAKTKAAVQCFQASNGLTADGVVGPMTGAALSSVTGSGSTGSGSSNLPAGCTSTAGYSPVNGQPCNSSTGSTGNGTLSGGAGTLDFTSTSSGIEDSVKESEEDVPVLAFKAEADGSDIALTNLKVVLKNDGYLVSSERLDRYIDEVSVWQGDTKVGSADADEFSKSSKSGADGYSKTISLSGAIVRDGDKDTFYVSVTAKSVIDSDDMDANWNIAASTARYTDATGAILSEDVSEDENFTFDDAAADDDISVKTSSNDPDAQNLVVEENKKSDEYLIGAFKLDVDDDSSDITINELPIKLTVANGGTNADSADNIFSKVKVKIDGHSFDADLDTDSITNGSGTATYLVDLDNNGYTIDSGDTQEVEIYATFAKQNGNYTSGTTVSAAANGSGFKIGAENADNGDTVTVDNSFAGETHTLVVSGAAVTYVSDSFTAENVSDGVDGTISIILNVTAVGDDVVLADDGSNIDYLLTGGTETGATLSVNGVTAHSGNYTISEGSTKKVTLSLKFNNTSGFVKLTVNSVAGTPVSNIKTDAH